MARTDKTVADSLTDQEKAAARVALILQQTNAVEGDFVRTSDQLANKRIGLVEGRKENLVAGLRASSGRPLDRGAHPFGLSMPNAAELPRASIRDVIS